MAPRNKPSRGRPSDVHELKLSDVQERSLQSHGDPHSVVKDVCQLSLEDLPHGTPREDGALAPRTRPDSFPLAPNRQFRRPASTALAGGHHGGGGGGRGGILGVDLAGLPRECPTEDGALAPRLASKEMKGAADIYGARSIVSLRACARALAVPLCDELASLQRMCRELDVMLRSDSAQVHAFYRNSYRLHRCRRVNA